MQLHRYAIALGSNRRHGRHGRPEGVLKAAFEAVQAAGITLVARSDVIGTSAIGPGGRRFANAAILVDTMLDPPALLVVLKRIEAEFGRRRGRRWGARVLDLDILLWSGGRWPQAVARLSARQALAIPHRALGLRDFVLRPLAQIAPRWPTGQGHHTVIHARERLRRYAG